MDEAVRVQLSPQRFLRRQFLKKVNSHSPFHPLESKDEGRRSSLSREQTTARSDLRTAIYEPDHLIILDATLIKSTNVFSGLKAGGTIIVNSPSSIGVFNFPHEYSAAAVDAAGIAAKHNLGTKSIPIVNTSILGAFAKFTGVVGIDALIEAVREEVPSKPDENAAAAREAYEATDRMVNAGASEKDVEGIPSSKS